MDSIHHHISEGQSLNIDICRALAIFSVICAHVADNSSTVSNLIVLELGTYGVGVFFFLSGYFFESDSKNFNKFVFSKIRSIIIPWFFCGTIFWSLLVIRGRSINFNSWLNLLFIRSHYYYLTVLIIFFLVFYPYKKKIMFLYFASILSIISCGMTHFKLLPIYSYINPFNWAFYFVLGMLVSRYSLYKKIVCVSRSLLIYSIPLFLLCYIQYVFDGMRISYWGHGGVPLVLFLLFICLGAADVLSYIMSNPLKCVLTDIGKKSYCIFLIHLPFVGLINIIFTKMGFYELMFIRPFITLLATYIFVRIITRVLSCSEYSKNVLLLIGIR